MSEVDKALRYIFVLSLILVLVAYWAGSVKLLNAFGANLNTLDLTLTGRNSSGNFAAYPSGAPSGV